METCQSTQKRRFMGKEVREISRFFGCAVADVSPLCLARFTHILIKKYTPLSRVLNMHVLGRAKEMSLCLKILYPMLPIR